MDNYNSIYTFSYQKNKLISFNVAAFILLILWLIPPIHELFLWVDEKLFIFLNRPLSTNKIWQTLWEIGSTRGIDLISGMVMLFFLIKGNRIFRKEEVRQALFGFCVLLVLLLIIRTLFTKGINIIGMQHSSPSLTIEGAFRLSEQKPDYYPDSWELKDASVNSFPGDHASVLLLWAFFTSYYSKKITHILLIWLVACIFMLPRLVAGAHWASDDYIGGVFIAMLTFVWGIYTPLLAKMVRSLLRLTRPLFLLTKKIPLINRLNIVQYES